MSKIVEYGDKKIGKGQPIFIVMEAGATHNGLDTAKKLVDVAVKAGADAIKFQMLRASDLVSSKEVLFKYKVLVDKNTKKIIEISEPLLDILKRRELTREEWVDLINYCKQREILFFSTVTTVEELEFLYSHGVRMIKICSGDINYHYLLAEAAKYDWIVQIDTGLATLGEVEEAIDILERNGCDKIIINHCPSGYPSPLQGVNLRILITLQAMFPYPVAFSDHFPGRDADIAAVALGANIIEKTITLDKTIRSPEHIMSLEPDEAYEFVKAIRNIEMMMGSRRKSLTKEELDNRKKVRRSLFARVNLKKGEFLKQNMIEYRRPGDGIEAHLDFLVLGKRLKRDVLQGEKLYFNDFE
ncbi:N,N'-diacetyllegionaminate synthase [Desulfonauticus submarinus]|uniref:N,N'-diacetyllegionaminate synthase n=1 Tax=Desulfonauticus submarinus TaxID=206665 RepID=A0A1H0BG24_9BACT|nr:N-acetylneuraminate synthase family protein [Desulfonauticus submarinus]SDN44561.1 N,N'-diacetyllegionaminate synthase [Desulfonauticus submarinus]